MRCDCGYEHLRHSWPYQKEKQGHRSRTRGHGRDERLPPAPPPSTSSQLPHAIAPTPAPRHFPALNNSRQLSLRGGLPDCFLSLSPRFPAPLVNGHRDSGWHISSSRHFYESKIRTGDPPPRRSAEQERGQTWLPVKLCVAEIRMFFQGFYDLEPDAIFAFMRFCDFVPSLFAFYTTFGRSPIRVSSHL